MRTYLATARADVTGVRTACERDWGRRRRTGASLSLGPGTAYLLPARSWPAWNRKVRVRANSPSLCPTMASVMYTGTCLRPSWTAMVWPTMSGITVERRDHVLMTRFSPRALRASTFFSRWSSMNGPFFRLRAMGTPTLSFSSARAARPAAADDQLLGRLVGVTGAALGLAPGRHRVATT